MSDKSSHQQDEFARQAEQSSSGLVSEVVSFLRYNKKWWLLPILLVLLVVGLIIVIGGTAGAPFLYTLF